MPQPPSPAPTPKCDSLTLRGHSSSINSAAFHATAPILATGSYDGSTKLWKHNGTAVSCVGTLDQSPALKTPRYTMNAALNGYRSALKFEDQALFYSSFISSFDRFQQLNNSCRFDVCVSSFVVNVAVHFFTSINNFHAQQTHTPATCNFLGVKWQRYDESADFIVRGLTFPFHAAHRPQPLQIGQRLSLQSIVEHEGSDTDKDDADCSVFIHDHHGSNRCCHHTQMPRR